MPRLGSAEVVYKSVGLDQLKADIKSSESAFKTGATAAAAYAVAIGAAIVKIGMPFEQMILNAGAAMRATETEFKNLEAAARKAGATTEHTATQAAESLMFLGKAGLSAGQAMQALPAMMNFKTAIGDLMSLGQATDVITDSMTSMGLEVKDLTHLTDLFIAVSNRSSTDAAKLGESFSKVAGIARLYGTSVEDLTALLGIQASAGLKAELAGTQLKNAFINTSRAAAELGIENKGLIPTLQAVAAANWDADKIASVYGRIALPSVVAILQKIDGSGPGSLSYFREELSHASDGMGEAAIQAEKMRSSVQNQFKIVISQVEDLALSIFDKWKPAMLDGIKTLQDFIKSNKDLLLGLADALGPTLKILGVGGALILGLKAVALMTPILATAFGALSTSIGIWATSEASAMTILNTQLFGVSLSAKAATGALGVLSIAAGVLFAAFAGWQIGKYLYDQFEFARVWGVHFVSTIQRGFIELQYVGEVTWVAIKNASIAPMEFMMNSFAKLTDVAASAMGALGQTDEQSGFAKMSLDIKQTVRSMGEWAGSIDDVSERRKNALKIHDATVDAIYREAVAGVTWAEQMKGHNDRVTEDKAKQNKILADLRGRQTASEIAELNKVSEAEIAAAEKRISAQEELSKRTGMLSKSQYEEKLKWIDAEVTRFRLANADELQITKFRNDELNKLNQQYFGKTSKQLEADGKAKKKSLDDALKDEFAFLDKREKAIGKSLEQERKAKEAAIKEIAKLESTQLKEFEKTLDDSKKHYEDFLEDQLGIKELSAESIAEIDAEYARIFADVQAGNIESFNDSMTAILEGKELNIEALKENDALYSVFLREQEAVNRETRLEFYKNSGIFSEEYYASEVARINEYSEKLRAAGVDAVDIERDKTAKMRELDIQKLESSNTFFGGVRAAMLENQKDAENWTARGKEIYNTFVNETGKAFSTLINSAIKGDMDGLRGAWDSLWQGMLGKVTDILGQMAAEFAAQKIAQGAMFLLESFETGVFDYQPKQGTPQTTDGGFLSVLHPGESVIPADITQSLKDATGFDEWYAKIKESFGFGDSAPSDLWNQVSDYSGAGRSLYDAFNKFKEGDDIGGIADTLSAMSEAFQSYGQQYGSEVATNIGAGLGSAANAVTSGYGAYTSYEAENYLQATTQALQTVQSLADAYSLATTGAGGTTIGGASLGGALAGAGYGTAAWNLLAYLGNIRAASKAESQWGAAAGGAGAGLAFGGAIGAAVGGIIGGIGGGAYAASREDEFDLSDLDPWIRSNREISGGKIATLPPSTDPSWFGITQSQYYDHLNLQAQAVNSITDTILENVAPDIAQKYVAAIDAELSRSVGNIDSGGNYNRNRSEWAVANVGNFWWKETLDAVTSAISATDGIPDGLRSQIGGMISKAMPTDYVDPMNPESNIKRDWEQTMAASGFSEDQIRRIQEERIVWEKERMMTGGAAKGGVVIPGSEDGILGVKTDEGILPVPALKWAEDIGKMIQSGGLFGGQFPEFDTSADIQPREITVTFPDDAGRSNVMTEINTQATSVNTAITNERLEKIIEKLEQLVGISQGIKDKPAPRITQSEFVGFVAPGIADQIRSGRLDIGLDRLERNILHAFGR